MIGTIVAAIAFFDAVFLGTPIALLTASFRPSLVLVAATVAVALLVIGCCSWIDRRWDDWIDGKARVVTSVHAAPAASRDQRYANVIRRS